MRKVPFSFALALAAALLFAGFAHADLVSHWPFNGNLDDVVGPNEGSFLGTPAPTFVDGYDGTPSGAVLFASGTAQGVQITQADRLPASGNPAFTITMWVKGTRTSAIKDRRIFCEASTVSNNHLYAIGTDSTTAVDSAKIDVLIRNGANTSVVNHLISQQNAFDDTWHHVAWIDDNGMVALYIDGKRDGTNFNYERSALVANRTAIGTVLRAAASTPFPGAIDEVRFYNHALTSDEVAALLPDPIGGCPTEGDTHITDLAVDGTANNLPGLVTFTATATDDSGDPILYHFKAQSDGGATIEFGPWTSNTATFLLLPGTWTVTARVDDSVACDDAASDAVLVKQVVIDGSPQLVGRWPFDGDLLDAANDNDGTFVGAAPATFTQGFDGTANGAVLLDGVDDYVNVAQASGLPIYNTTNAYTVALWVKGTSQADRRVFAEASTLNGQPLVNIGTSLTTTTDPRFGKVKIYMRGAGGIFEAYSDRTAFDAAWHHIAWVDDNGKAVMYIDGIRDARDFTYTRPKWILNTTAIGGILRATAGNWFAGAIDDVRIYNYALTEAEVLAIVPEPPGCPTEGDTHVTALDIAGPAEQTAGAYTATATATDDSGDPTLYYTFVAQSAAGARIQYGPQTANAATFTLPVGVWTLTATVDDDLGCRDKAADATKTVVREVFSEQPIMISRFAFDGNLLDAQPAGNNGTLLGYVDVDPDPAVTNWQPEEGTPTFDADIDCTNPGALVLGGDATMKLVKLTYGAKLPLIARDAFSVAVWVKGMPQNDRRVFSESSSTVNNTLYNIGTANDGASGSVDIYIRTDANVTLVNHLKSTATAFDGTWHHIAWVDNKGQTALYVDGVLDATNFSYTRGGLTTDTTSFGGIFRLGRLPGANPVSNVFAGQLDDARIFSYALSAAEVQAIYGDGASHCCPAEGDTHCTNLTVVGPGTPGTYTATCTATDDSGDPISYTFTADDGAGTVLTAGPQAENTAGFTLGVGVWTFMVAVDDDPLCPDAAGDATCTTSVRVCPAEGDTHCAGLVVEGSGTAGTYTLTCTATDDSSDPISYTFTADNGAGTVLTSGPQGGSATNFELQGGTWTVAVSVDDDPDCTDAAADATCTQIVKVCPLQGDTHCQGLVVEGSGTPGAYTATCTAIDISGDPISYLFTADNGAGTVLTVDPQEANATTFDLTEGTWTVTVVVDDDPACADAAGDASCTKTVDVGPAGVKFTRGDSNADGTVNIADAICTLSYLFGRSTDPCKPLVLQCLDASNSNDDAEVNIADAIKTLAHLFAKAGPLPEPTSCGLDPEGITIGCVSFSPCP